MPNLKIYVESGLWTDHRAELLSALPPIRDMLCADLKVGASACQLTVVPVHGLADLPLVNAEILVLAAPDRTRALLEGVCRSLQERLSQASGGARTAVRCSQIDADAYFALK